MVHYVAVVDRAEGTDYGVTFPDFPGCVTTGATLDEAARMAREALAAHVAGMVEDGEPLPAPSPLRAVVAAPEYAEGVEAFLPVEVDAEPTAPEPAARINITLEVGLLRRIDFEAERRGLKRSTFLAWAARQALAQSPDEAGGSSGGGHASAA